MKRAICRFIDIKIMRKNRYELTNIQFEALREKLNHRLGAERFDDGNVEAAYAVMVKGESVIQAANASGRSRQNLHRVVRDLWAIFNDMEPPSRILQRQTTQKARTPKNWVRVTVILPPELAKSVQELEIKARTQLEDLTNSPQEQHTK